MLKVQTAFEVYGTLDGFAEAPLRIKFAVIQDDLLVGNVTQDASPDASDIVLFHAKTSLDFFESTESQLVYSCQFSLVKHDTKHATIIDCAARISAIGGLVGRWNAHGSLGKKGVCDHAFEMKSILPSTGSDADTTATDSTLDAVTISSAVDISTMASASVREVLVCGDAVDQNGNIYTTTLQATLHSDGSVTGVSSEDGKRCKLTGVWSGHNLSYTIDYPLDDFVTHYTFRGVLTTNDDGTESFTGTWKFETRSPDDDEMYGGFAFTSPRHPEPTMLPGEYAFTGTATSDNGITYETTLTLHLAENGTLVGTSQELSQFAPHVYQLTGFWDGAERTITYRTSDSDGTGSYAFVGRLHGQQLTGRWVNARARQLASERGAFVFRRTSYGEASVSTTKLLDETLPPPSAPDQCRELEMRGEAVDQRGNTYATTLQAMLHRNGTITGTSTESGKPCKLTGEWSGNTATYTIDYPMDSVVTQYTYRGVLATNADGTETLSGTWKFDNNTSEEDALFGGFTFAAVKGEKTIDADAILPGTYVFTGAAISDGGTTYASMLTLHLTSDGAINGTSQELSIAPQVCVLTGTWDIVHNKIQYCMRYTNGATGSYEYKGALENQHLVGRWVNPHAAERESERGDFKFRFTTSTPTADQAAADTTSSDKSVS